MHELPARRVKDGTCISLQCGCMGIKGSKDTVPILHVIRDCGREYFSCRQVGGLKHAAVFGDSHGNCDNIFLVDPAPVRIEPLLDELLS